MRSDDRKKPAEGQTTRAPAKSGQHRSQQDTAPSSSITHTHYHVGPKEPEPTQVASKLHGISAYPASVQ